VSCNDYEEQKARRRMGEGQALGEPGGSRLRIAKETNGLRRVDNEIQVSS